MRECMDSYRCTKFSNKDSVTRFLKSYFIAYSLGLYAKHLIQDSSKIVAA